MPEQPDVLILGAGLSGLTAAHRLVSRGVSCAVLEARDRVGGRIENRAIGDGEVVEVGGAYMGEAQPRLAALAGELGVTTFETFADGRAIYHRRGRNHLYNAAGATALLRHEPLGTVEYALARVRLQRLANRIDLDTPWASRDAVQLDSRTAEQWGRRLRTPGARMLFEATVRGMLAAEPGEASLLGLVTHIRSAGNDRRGFDRLVRTRRNLRYRFAGGSHRLCQLLAEQLGHAVVVGAPVTGVRQDAGGVSVTSGATTHRARKLIVTASPALLPRIEWHPRLPDAWADLARQAPLGNVAKVHAVYETPFWRDDGLSGEVVSDDGPVEFVYDSSPRSGAPGVLVGFVLAGHAQRWKEVGPSERRAVAIDCLVRYFGPRAASPEGYHEKAWSDDQWSTGCYGTVLPRGVLTSLGPNLNRTWKHVHFAGADLARVWSGHMEGAVRSGEQASEAVARAIA